MRPPRGIYKSRSQLAGMRRPGEITRLGIEAAVAAAKAGATTLEVDAAAEAAIRREGGEPNFMLEDGYHHTICASVNEELVHGIPGGRVLDAGDLLTIDCGAIVEGMNGDSAVSIVIPGASGDLVDERTELSRVTREALWHGIAALAKASYLGEVGEAIDDYVASQRTARGTGYGLIEDYIGHGIGKQMHEDPPVFNYRTKLRGPAVKAGLCVAIEPMLTTGSIDTRVEGDAWTVVTSDGSQACQWEHSVAVHSGGIWVLTAADGGADELARFGVTPVPIPDR